MKSAIAVITYRRLHALKEELDGISKFCADYPLGVFEDCGQADATSSYLSTPATRVRKPRPELVADEWVLTDEAKQRLLTEEEKLLGTEPIWPRHFLGTRNVGVAGNSNRALKWFMDETDADHLCLLNDDLHVLGDFVQFYRTGHRDLDMGMFCFLPTGGVYDHDSYKPVIVRTRGYQVRLMPRFTGIMISVTRKLIEKMGYFDASFGQFGEEHCDFTIRARFAGGIQLEGMAQNCIDIVPPQPLLRHQDVQTSVVGVDRAFADRESVGIMQKASESYVYRHYYRPFAIKLPRQVATFGKQPGIPYDLLLNHALVQPVVTT
jgi:hypothetical protein